MQSQQPRPLNEVYSIFDQALLGKGSTGNVYLGCANSNPAQKVAIKAINLHQINNEVTRYLLSCEIAALSNLGKLENTQHDNLVRLLEIIILDNYIYLVMQLLQGGTLADYIRKHPDGLPEDEVLVILRQILQGYKRIKDKHIVHRDLKPDNILFKTSPEQNKRIAIIDFGYCEMKEVPNKPNMFYNVGSPKYMSPEAYKSNKYSQKSDIWAIGVMLYEMLIGKTCDYGMNMQGYLEMLETRGVPLPNKLKNIHKHLLNLMLTYSDQARIQCDEVLRILSSHQNPAEMHPQQLLPNRQEYAYLRATMELQPMQRPNRNNPIFHSAFLPSQIGPNINHHSQQPLQIMRMPRSQSRLSDSNQNMQEIRGFIRDSGTTLVNDQRPKRVVIQQKMMKVDNVELNSAKQVIHRKHPGNALVQLKAINTSPFAKQGAHFFQHQNSLPQHMGQQQQIMQLERPMMNQQNVKMNLPYQVKPPNTLPPPNHELTYSKIIHHPNQPQQVLSNSNQNQKVHINPFQITRNREMDNFNEHLQLKKHVSEDVRFGSMQHFMQENQNRRQSVHYVKQNAPENKIQVLHMNQPKINHEMAVIRHPFPDMTQTLRPQQDLTHTRVPHYESQSNGFQRPDLTQTRFPIQLVSNDLTISKAPRASREAEFFHKQTHPQHSHPSQGFNQGNEYHSERIQLNRPIQMVRENISLRPQVTAIRNVDNKINYVRLHPAQPMHPHQQPHLMLFRPNIVK